MSKYIFDGHKLVYHIDRVNNFLERGDCFPLYMEISIVGSCNHRCIFCAYDYIGHPNRKLETNALLRFIDQLSECGVRSILYAGEGEPLLHPDVDKFVARTAQKGIDAGMYTNGQMLKKELSKKILPYLTFLRFSFNAGTETDYARIHNVKPGIFSMVLKNIEDAVKLKRQGKLNLDIGLQYVLLPENIKHLGRIVKIFKGIGIDYFAIKPFVKQSKLQAYQMKKAFDLNFIKDALDEAASFSGKNFKVIARRDSFENYGKRNYKYCYGTSFISVVNSAGEVASCLPYWDRKDFIFGNIYENTFKEIWLGKRRKKIKEFITKKMSAAKCPPNCRPNAVNEFLFEVKNPSVKHVNFI